MEDPESESVYVDVENLGAIVQEIVSCVVANWASGDERPPLTRLYPVRPRRQVRILADLG